MPNNNAEKLLTNRPVNKKNKYFFRIKLFRYFFAIHFSFLRIFLHFRKYSCQKKIKTNRETVSSIPRKILECDIELYCYKKISKISNVSFNLQNFKTLKKVKD